MAIDDQRSVGEVDLLDLACGPVLIRALTDGAQ